MVRNTWRAVAATALFLAIGFTWQATLGQTKKRERDRQVETFLPADAVAYVRHDGSAAHRKEWELTAAYQSLVKSGLWKSAEQWIAASAKLNPEADKFVAQLVPLFRQAATDGFSASLRLQKSGDQYEPQLTVVLHKGAAKESDIFKLLKTADPQAQEDTVQGKRVLRGKLPGESQEWGCWSDGGHLVLTLGRDAVNSVMQRLSSKLPDVRGANLWRKNNVVPKGVTLMTVAWVDLEQINKLVKNVPLPPDPNVQPTPTVGELLDLLGVANVQNLVLQSGLQGKACWSQMRLEGTGDRRGLLKLADARPFQLSDLPALPEKTNNVSAVAVNWAGAYDEGWNQARAFAKKIGQSAGLAEAEAQWKQTQDKMGWSVRDDLLASLGQLHVMFVPTSAIGGVGLGVAVQVADADKLRKVLNQVLDQIPQIALKPPEVVRTNQQGQEIISLNVGAAGMLAPAFPSLCVTDKWLVVGVSKQTVESFLLLQDGQLPAWKPDAELSKTLAELPQSMQSLSISDPKAMVLGIGQMAPQVMAGAASQMQGGFPKELTTVNFPPVDQIAQPLFPNVSVMTVENGQIVVTGKTSLPILSGGDASSVAVAAVGVALLLPAVQQARMAARRVQSRNNMKQIGLALHSFESAFRSFPPGTMPGPGKPEDRLSWQAAILPYVEQQPLYKQLDRAQGWKSGANTMAGQVSISTFLNPGLPPAKLANDLKPTDYAGLAGLGVDGPKLKVSDKGAGIFAYDRVTRIPDVTDGTSNTLMIGEVSADRGPWIQGGPATIRPLSKQPYINGPDGYGGGWVGGSHFLNADGSVRFLSEKTDPAVMEALTTIRGGETVKLDP